MNHTPAPHINNTDLEQKSEASTFANLMDRIILALPDERDLVLGQHDTRMDGLPEMPCMQLQLQCEVGVVQSTHQPSGDVPQPFQSTGNFRQKVERASLVGICADHTMSAPNDREGYLQ